MKKTLFLFVICFSFNISAQNPFLEGTYYFYGFPVDLGSTEPITPGDAPQNPYIIINADYTFEGLAACNTYSGKFVYDLSQSMYIVENFTKSIGSCGNSQYNQFENHFFSEFDYFIDNLFNIEGGGDYLYLESYPGFGLEFIDSPILVPPSLEDTTWYLHEIDPDSMPIYVSNIEPAIIPTLQFNQYLSYTGEGACNTFSGTYNLTGMTIVNLQNDFSQTNNTCINQHHTNFENTYFNFFEFGAEYFYSITYDPDGFSTLVLDTPLQFRLTYRNQQVLSNPNFSKDKITLYPNPVTNELNINSKGGFISQITIYTTTGQRITSEIYDGKAIDVSSLKSGIYFLELISEGKKMTKKFIKE